MNLAKAFRLNGGIKQFFIELSEMREECWEDYIESVGDGEYVLNPRYIQEFSASLKLFTGGNCEENQSKIREAKGVLYHKVTRFLFDQKNKKYRGI